MVFLVDDDPLVLKALARQLQRRGLEVTAFRSPREAMAALQTMPAAVLTDLNMPEMTGIDLLRAVRERCPAARRVLLSAAGKVDAAFDPTVCDEVLLKPWELDRVVAALQPQPRVA